MQFLTFSKFEYTFAKTYHQTRQFGVLMSLITFRVRRSRGEMYIGHGRLCVFVCPSPHSHTTARTRMRMGVPSSCALLGGFAT